MDAESAHTKTRLAQWRKDEGLSLSELSDLTGLSVSMLSRVERAQRQLRPATKVLMARRAGVPVRDLFEVEEIDEVSA